MENKIELENNRPEYIIGQEYEWLGLNENNQTDWGKFIMTEEILRVHKSYTIRNIVKDLTEEQMEAMSLDELQEVIETMNKGKQIDNQEFENFQVLLEKDINIKVDRDLVNITETFETEFTEKFIGDEYKKDSRS